MARARAGADRKPAAAWARRCCGHPRKSDASSARLTAAAQAGSSRGAADIPRAPDRVQEVEGSCSQDELEDGMKGRERRQASVDIRRKPSWH